MMYRNLRTMTLLAVSLILAGCQADLSTVAIRFNAPLPPEMAQEIEARQQLAGHQAQDPNDPYVYETVSAFDLPFHSIALWGGKFHGNDVTFADTPLEPGDYTFGMWETASGSTMQGWMRVNAPGSEFIDVLQKWKANIPTQKKRLAQTYEIEGKLLRTDPNVFADFKSELQAIDNFDRQLDAAIAHEEYMQERQLKQTHAFLENTIVRVVPGREGYAHPTTEPAFNEDDLNEIRNGGPITKLLFVADFEHLQWKLDLVDGMHTDLMGWKAVLREEIDRLEDRKQLYRTIDLKGKNDRRFLVNETRLQRAIAALERVDKRLADLRKQRLACAFALGTTTPGTTLQPLQTERRDLEQERAMLVAEKARLKSRFEGVPEGSARWLALERRRQRLNRETENVEKSLGWLGEVEVAFNHLHESSNVIHRHGDFRLFAATFLDQNIPTDIRSLFERVSLMTIRLESQKNNFGPTMEGLAGSRESENFETYDAYDQTMMSPAMP